METWLPVVGFEGFYEVSDVGRVYSLDRLVLCGRGPGLHLFRGRVLRPCLNRQGYLDVALRARGRTRTYRVHRLVLEAFAGPRPRGMEALHGSAGRLDNSLANLEWGTRRKNLGPDKYRDGTMPLGTQVNNARLTEDAVREIRSRYAAGEMNQYELAAEYGVDQNTVWKVVHRRTWAHV